MSIYNQNDSSLAPYIGGVFAVTAAIAITVGVVYSMSGSKDSEDQPSAMTTAIRAPKTDIKRAALETVKPRITPGNTSHV